MTTSSSRGTRQIGVRPATNLLHAVRFAAERQQPLNLAVTINWHRLGVPDQEASNAFRQLRSKVRRRWTHLRKTRGVQLGTFDDTGSHENPGGRRNTHWLIRVPDFHMAAFRKDVERFLKKVLGRDHLGEALHVQPVRAAGTFAKYLVKGIDPHFADYFHMRAVDQGFIEGRGRTFVARSLGFASRAKVGWKRTRQKPRRP